MMGHRQTGDQSAVVLPVQRSKGTSRVTICCAGSIDRFVDTWILFELRDKLAAFYSDDGPAID